MFDSFFTKGHSHRVCEDYASHSTTMAILADGCSSVKHSDIGARALVHASLKHPYILACYASAYTSVHLLGLDSSCLACTLGKIYLSGENIVTELYGDGAACIKFSDSYNHIYDIDYENKPYYPYYDCEGLRDQYIKTFGEVNYSMDITDGERSYIQKYPLPLMYQPSLSITHRVKEVKAIFLFSDGIKSFGQDMKDLINDVVDVQSWNGEFVTRRLKKLLSTKWKDYRHDDDVSCIGFCNESLC